jgi:WD40 repeat protein
LNAALPRLASSSKDATVRVWNAKSRKLEFTLGSHTASVNVVRWGGEGVIYTASSDRTVKLWDGKDVSIFSQDNGTFKLIEIIGDGRVNSFEHYLIMLIGSIRPH